MTSLSEYQRKAFQSFKMAGNSQVDEAHLAFGLLAEAGEIATLYQKMYRGDPSYLDYDWDYHLKPEKVELLKKELGDVLWHVSAMALLYGFTLEEIAEVNLQKLKDRAKKGTIRGDGDER